MLKDIFEGDGDGVRPGSELERATIEVVTQTSFCTDGEIHVPVFGILGQFLFFRVR